MESVHSCGQFPSQSSGAEHEGGSCLCPPAFPLTGRGPRGWLGSGLAGPRYWCLTLGCLPWPGFSILSPVAQVADLSPQSVTQIKPSCPVPAHCLLHSFSPHLPGISGQSLPVPCLPATSPYLHPPAWVLPVSPLRISVHLPLPVCWLRLPHLLLFSADPLEGLFPKCLFREAFLTPLLLLLRAAEISTVITLRRQRLCVWRLPSIPFESRRV